MPNSKLIKYALLNSVGVFIYVTSVATIMQNGEKIFGERENFFGPIAFLMLFVLSATVCGALVLGRPILFYLDGLKKEAVKLFGYTIGWLLAITIVVFAVMLAI